MFEVTGRREAGPGRRRGVAAARRAHRRFRRQRPDRGRGAARRDAQRSPAASRASSRSAASAARPSRWPRACSTPTIPTSTARRLEQLARVTPAQVRAAMQRWLTRPVYALRVDPGERGAYQEARRPLAPRPRPRAAAPRASRGAAAPRLQMPGVAEHARARFPRRSSARGSRTASRSSTRAAPPCRSPGSRSSSTPASPPIRPTGSAPRR